MVQLQKSHVPLPKLLCLVYLIVLDLPVITALQMTGLSNHTVIDWYNFIRDICTQALTELDWKLGKCHITEIDEAKFCKKRKYGKGKPMSHEEWMFGMAERQTKIGGKKKYRKTFADYTGTLSAWFNNLS